MQINIIYVIINIITKLKNYMVEDIQNTLSIFGLKPKEISIYLVCLRSKHGMFVSGISKLTKIKRSTVNLILERLIKKGFISFCVEGNRKCFAAESPDAILHNLQDSVNDFHDIIPILKAEQIESSKTRFKVFDEKNMIEKIFNDIILTMRRRPGEKILAISSGEDIFSVMPNHHKKFIDKRIKERIPIKWIAPESEKLKKIFKEDKQSLREMKFFDSKKYPFNVEIDIYGNKIAFFILEGRPMGAIIENESLAKSSASIFNLLWHLI